MHLLFHLKGYTMGNNEIIGLWTIPKSVVLEAVKRSGITLPDWWEQADKVSVQTDPHGITFIGRKCS